MNTQTYTHTHTHHVLSTIWQTSLVFQPHALLTKVSAVLVTAQSFLGRIQWKQKHCGPISQVFCQSSWAQCESPAPKADRAFITTVHWSRVYSTDIFFICLQTEGHAKRGLVERLHFAPKDWMSQQACPARSSCFTDEWGLVSCFPAVWAENAEDVISSADGSANGPVTE